MTTSQNPCPALAGIAKAILSTLSAEDLADVLKSVEPTVMQEALVRSEIVGMDSSHLQLAIDYELITKETIFNVLGVDWIEGHFATALGSVIDPSLDHVLLGHTFHEVMNCMDGIITAFARSLLLASVMTLALTSTASAQNTDRIKIFLDCRYCDDNYVRTEINYVNYVRDRKEADVHIQSTRLRTGSGGREYTVTFLGGRNFSGLNDTLTFASI